MVNRPKQIGTAGETAVVRYLIPNGFPDAERIALHGNADQGDVATLHLAWEVKAGKAAETASDAQVEAWLAETEVERRHRKADHGILVLKRAGKGAANAGLWWAIMPGATFAALVTDFDQYDDTAFPLPPVRMTLAQAVHVLRLGGYGTPLEAAA